MTALVIILAVLLGVLLYLLFAPFYLEVDSNRNLFGIRFHRLASARLQIRDYSLIMDLNLAGWKKAIDLLQKKAPRKSKEARKKEARSGFPVNKILPVVRSFKVKACRLNVDLNDPVWNGMLYPLFFGLGQMTGAQLAINFLGINEVKLEVRNNAARILRAYIFTSS